MTRTLLRVAGSLLLMAAASLLLATVTPVDFHRQVPGSFLRILTIVSMAGVLALALAFNVERYPETGVRYEIRVAMYAWPALLAMCFGLTCLLLANRQALPYGLLIVSGLFSAVFVMQHMVLMLGPPSELMRWESRDGSGELVLRIGFAVVSLVPLVALWFVIGPALLSAD